MFLLALPILFPLALIRHFIHVEIKDPGVRVFQLLRLSIGTGLISLLQSSEILIDARGVGIIFLAVMVAVGIYSRKQASSVDGFVLGGRSVGPWLTAFAYGTSYFSAVVFVGYAGQFGWKYGLSSTWIGVGNAVIGSLLAWLLLGRRTKLMTQHIESRTMPDFFGTRFDSQGLRVVASVIAFVFLIPYTAGVYKGISTLFEMGFGIPYEYCVIIMAILTAFYVILGGYKATAMNDFIQGIIMLFGIVTVVAAVLNRQGGL
jgi:SSS family solute:Na+ symporter